MKTRLLIIILFVFSVIVVIPATAQEYDCVEMDIKIESTKNMDWKACYLEEYASLLIKTSSEESTDNKIILQKDTFWNYDVDCSPTRFFTLINGEEIYQQEEYFDDYRILSIPLEKGENEIEIIIATIPGMYANEYCLTEPVEPIPNLSEGIVDCVGGYYFNGISCVPEPDCPAGTELRDSVCNVIDMDVPPFNNGDCLIATASYGSELAPQVQMLREIRDNVLLNTESGKIFMDGFNTIYYSFSPQIAQLENDNELFKEAVKIFITPMVTTLSIMTLVDEGSELQVILFGASTIGIIVGMYVVAPVVLVWKVGKRK